jgi:tetratricopeptide (TPR) repeat protein
MSVGSLELLGATTARVARLDSGRLGILQVLAECHLPVNIETIRALLVPEPYSALAELDSGLGQLQEQGLLAIDQRIDKRYTLPPLVRDAVRDGFTAEDRLRLRDLLRQHFETLPAVDYGKVVCLDDLASAIELYHALIGLHRYDDAFMVFRSRLSDATLFRLNAIRERVQLLELLIPDGVGAVPRLSSARDQVWVMNNLAMAVELRGRPGSAAPLFQLAAEISMHAGDYRMQATSLNNLAYCLRLTGSLRASVVSARTALALSHVTHDLHQEGVSQCNLGIVATTCGDLTEADKAMWRAAEICQDRSTQQCEGYLSAYLAELSMYRDDPVTARTLADRAWELAAAQSIEVDFIRAARLQGLISLALGELEVAAERFDHALTRLASCELVEEQLLTLVAMARLLRRLHQPQQAWSLLSELWKMADQGPYPLIRTDALNLQAGLAREVGNHDEAVTAAGRAYALAWSDGPPFAYYWGLQEARRLLLELGSPEPELTASASRGYQQDSFSVSKWLQQQTTAIISYPIECGRADACVVATSTARWPVASNARGINKESRKPGR